ncbi:excisionase Xis [Serratia marcescens]|uniref:excisionase Xis n=1 Tax=Serratia marcescens TaxID=615 RepID=UPI0030CFE617
MKAEEMLTSKDVRSLLKISNSSMYRLRHRDVNPFLGPDFYGVGEANKWFTSKVAEWQLAESQRAKVKPAEHLHEKTRRFSRRVV